MTRVVARLSQFLFLFLSFTDRYSGKGDGESVRMTQERGNLFRAVLYAIDSVEKNKENQGDNLEIEIYLLEGAFISLSRILFVAIILEDIGVINRVSRNKWFREITRTMCVYIYIYIVGEEYLIFRYCNNVCLP